MGQSNQYSCPMCRYSVMVCGGTEAGMFTSLTTISCVECTSLYDVQSMDFDAMEEVPLCCPRSPRHTVTVWTGSGPCPSCGTMMERDGLTMMWD